MSDLQTEGEDSPAASGPADAAPVANGADAAPVPDSPDAAPAPDAADAPAPPDAAESLPTTTDTPPRPHEKGEAYEDDGAGGSNPAPESVPSAEDALLESEARYRSLFEAIDEGFCIVEVLFDEDGDAVDYRFLETNPAFVEQTGIRGGEGRRVREFAPRHEDHWFEIYGRVALTGEPVRFTNAAKHLGDRWYDVYAFRVGEPEERKVAILFNDISERKRSEEALREAKRAAERASAVKSQFLSTMSHELRTPLNAVIGLADLLDSGLAGPVTPEQSEHLARIRAGAWHLVEIIEEILTFSRTEADRVDVRLEDVDVAELARDVVGMLRYEAEAKDLALGISGAAEPLPVETDGGKVRQVLTNLVGNAIRYTEEGSVEVEVERKAEAIAFVVRDTGPGIPSAWIEEIFEPFEQVETAGPRAREGTGLGLTICRRLATLLGGEVTVESTPGEGSCFTFLLPRSVLPDGSELPSRE